MNQVSEILGDKGQDVLKIDADASVYDAVKRMVESNVGSLLVTDGGEVSGIVTERDYLRRVILEGRTDQETAVREIASAPRIASRTSPSRSALPSMYASASPRLPWMSFRQTSGEATSTVARGSPAPKTRRCPESRTVSSPADMRERSFRIGRR